MSDLLDEVDALRQQLRELRRDVQHGQELNDQLRREAKTSRSRARSALRLDSQIDTDHLELVESQLSADDSETKLTHKPFLPDIIARLGDIVHCPGCSQTFAANKYQDGVKYSVEYHRHCTLECDEYEKLGQIRKCTECKLLFINARSFAKHATQSHKRSKPSWITKSTYKTALAVSRLPTATSSVACVGCGQRFKAVRQGRQPELAYYEHVIEQCAEYHKLALTEKCVECNCVFYNRRAYDLHTCHKRKFRKLRHSIRPLP